MPRSKLAFFGGATFGIYVIWWFWSQWRAEAPDDGRWSAAFKTVFGPIFLYGLAAQVKDRAEKLSLPCGYSPVLLTVVFVAIWIALDKLPDGGMLVAVLLSPAPLLPVQGAINRVNAATSNGQPRSWRWWEKGLATVLALFWALLILGVLLPTPTDGGNLAQMVPSAPASRSSAKNLPRM